MKVKRRSPIKKQPLRLPGQSLQEQRDEQLIDKCVFLFLMALFFIYNAGFQWWVFLKPRALDPIFATVLAVLFLIYTFLRIWFVWPKIKQFNQGIRGEKAVGQFLEDLRESGYKVFHDLQGEGFNLDHVLIGPAGVFTIETKTLSKPAKGETKLFFDGSVIQMNGKPLERNPVIQAKAQAAWMKQLMEDLTAKKLAVWPVVVFPGWYIERADNAHKELWVLEPKALPKFLENKDVIYFPEEVKVLANSLSRYIRQQEEQS